MGRNDFDLKHGNTPINIIWQSEQSNMLYAPMVEFILTTRPKSIPDANETFHFKVCDFVDE